MAVTASLTLTSAADDLTTDALALSTSTSLTKAGMATTALSNTSGLARKTTTSASEYILFDADEGVIFAVNEVEVKLPELTVVEDDVVADTIWTILPPTPAGRAVTAPKDALAILP